MCNRGQTKEGPRLYDGVLKGNEGYQGRDDISTQLIVQGVPMSVDEEEENLKVVCSHLLRCLRPDGL